MNNIDALNMTQKEFVEEYQYNILNSKRRKFINIVASKDKTFSYVDEGGCFRLDKKKAAISAYDDLKNYKDFIDNDLLTNG